MGKRKELESIKERMAAWWDHEILDRPVIAYSYRKLNFKRSASFDRKGLSKNIDDVETYHAEFVKHIRNRFYGGEQFPNCWANYGPGIMAAVLGATAEFKSGTMWFYHETETDEIISTLESAKINANNPWYDRLCKVTRYLAERSGGEYAVALTDLGGILDILASFLEPRKIIVAMRRKPELIDTCRAIILEKTLQVYDKLQGIIDEFNLGCNSWLDVWCPKHWYPMQSDFAAMLSPKWFRRFVLPDLVAQAEHMDYAIYHLDGPNQLPYVDDLIAEPSITGIQWVPGIQEAAMESNKWFPLYKKIQNAGKNLVIHSSPLGAPRLYKQLSAKGLYVITGYASRFDAKLLLPGFMNGWGKFLENKQFKSMDDMMIVKTKTRLRIHNQAT